MQTLIQSKKKIAIVYDWIDKWGGVERVLLTLHQMFPTAIFYTSSYDPKEAGWAKDIDIKTSFIQKFPKFIRGYRITSLPFYPFAFEFFNFNNYDLVISVSSSFAKSVITNPGTIHISYLLTPTRFLWSHEQEYLKKPESLLLVPYINYLKKWDRVVAWRPDKIVSISHTVVNRCEKFYHRDSEVIFPPFDTNYWKSIKSKVESSHFAEASRDRQKSKFQVKNKNYFLVVARLEKYKKVDLVIEAFNQLPKEQLKIVGIGSQEKTLKQKAHSNITFLGKVSDKDLATLYFGAQALIMPQEEDFGYVSLEAQFFGCPVIAYEKGGASETVIEEKTGLFFKKQTSESLIAALEQFHIISYNLQLETRKLGMKNIERFDKKIFVKQFNSVIIQMFKPKSQNCKSIKDLKF